MSMENCSLVILQILAEFRLERAAYKTLHHFFLLNGLSNFAQNVTVGFLKLLSTHPIIIYIVVWGNFPFKEKEQVVYYPFKHTHKHWGGGGGYTLKLKCY